MDETPSSLSLKEKKCPLGALVRPQSLVNLQAEKLNVGDTAKDLSTAYVAKISGFLGKTASNPNLVLNTDPILPTNFLVKGCGIKLYQGVTVAPDGSYQAINPLDDTIRFCGTHEIVPFHKIVLFESIEVGDIWCLEKRSCIVISLSHNNKRNQGWTTRKITCMRPNSQLETVWPNYNFKVFKTNKQS
jgi:hypothetical protein